MKNTCKIFYLIMIFTTVGVSFAQNSPSVNPAERRAREIAEILTSGNRPAARKYVEANFSSEMLKVPMERHLYFVSSVHDTSRGFEVHSVQDAKPNQVTMLVKNKLTGEWDGLLVTVEENTPHKITGIGFRVAKPPIADSVKPSNAEVGREVEALMKKLVTADAFSGAVLIAKDGEPVFKGAYGMANNDFGIPNKIDTKFNLGSMNKMFTGLAIAQLVEKGKMSFEDPLSKFVPDFPDKESAEKIKIKHLLTHTAGLGGYFSKRYQESSRASLRTIDDMMRLARQDEKLLFEPGTKWQYSNTGMLVLGKVIEIVSGQTYYDYVRDNIYKPAGMTNTDCYELDRVNINLAIGYDKQYTDSGIAWSNNIFEHVMRGGPQGGGYSTVEDLLKFDRALRANKLIGAEYVKILTTPKPELNSPNYGYGFQSAPDGQSAGHSGGFPGISSNLNMYFGSGWTTIAMSNYSRGSGPVTQKMAKLVAAVGNAR